MVFSSYRNKACIDQKQTLIDLLIDWLAWVFICQHVSVVIGDRCSYYCLQLKLLDYCDALAMGCQSTPTTTPYTTTFCAFVRHVKLRHTSEVTASSRVSTLCTVICFFLHQVKHWLEIALWRKIQRY